MFRALRSLRERVLTPDISETRLVTRGFHIKNESASQLLETVGVSFLSGFRYAAGARTPSDAENQLETVDREFRGFAYEGAAMALGIMNGLRLTQGRAVERFLTGRADRHVYMVYIGAGWALARLPRWRWQVVLPAAPLLGWLALDGYGFHQAYFHTKRYVHGQYQDESLRWPADRTGRYANRVVDQGIGRALWFVEGADPDRVVRSIERFAPHRRADLFSGAGLAATYAGGATEAELEAFWDRAGSYRPNVAQGCAFAAKARVRAGLVTPHTPIATSVFCGTSPERAAAVTDDAMRDLPNDGPEPGYELWRQRIAEQFVSSGRC
ncbi:MAG TPA: DUF1702 family protein [Micromonosporaceae bacterium]|nr:DUF1702 family protein [Micromonosporaceae bacterium]